ncbi:MAG: DNA mismatch endonuclease Vsr [Desulfurivibrionaceae bacterium]|jgi:DNA mismatch endonuclease (patch repair protein)
MDSVDKTTRSRIMSRVGQKNTGPEMKLRGSLHRIGLRYKLHDKKLPGTPDIVFPRFKAVLFVHGCFWHRHGCNATTMPGTNVEFWRKKFAENIARDRSHIDALLDGGWRVAVVWECLIRGNADLEAVAFKVREWLETNEKYTSIPFVPRRVPRSGLTSGPVLS